MTRCQGNSRLFTRTRLRSGSLSGTGGAGSSSTGCRMLLVQPDSRGSRSPRLGQHRISNVRTGLYLNSVSFARDGTARVRPSVPPEWMVNRARAARCCPSALTVPVGVRLVLTSLHLDSHRRQIFQAAAAWVRGDDTGTQEGAAIVTPSLRHAAARVRGDDTGRPSTSRAMAQMNPSASRAIAVAATWESLPRRMSRW